jgi:hypothetical protein
MTNDAPDPLPQQRPPWPDWLPKPASSALGDAWRPFLARNPRLTKGDRVFLCRLMAEGLSPDAVYDLVGSYYADGPEGPEDDNSAEGYGRISDIEHLAGIEQDNAEDHEDDPQPT